HRRLGAGPPERQPPLPLPAPSKLAGHSFAPPPLELAHASHRPPLPGPAPDAATAALGPPLARPPPRHRPPPPPPHPPRPPPPHPIAGSSIFARHSFPKQPLELGHAGNLNRLLVQPPKEILVGQRLHVAPDAPRYLPEALREDLHHPKPQPRLAPPQFVPERIR